MFFMQKLQFAAALGLAAVLAISITTGVVLNARAEEVVAPVPTPPPAPVATPASAPAQANKPRSLTGTVKKLDEAKKTLGHEGCLIVRSAARWEQLQKALTDLGWEKPKKDPLGGVDFSRELLAGVFKYGDRCQAGETLACHTAGGDAKAYEVAFVMCNSRYNTKDELEYGWRFAFTAVPRAEKVKVSVGSYHPTNGGPNTTPEKAKLEWTETFDAARGDLVDGLSSALKTDAPKTKAGSDILAEFKLEFYAQKVSDGVFARKLDSAFVWDGKYSEGYRNHAFLVETPDGKTQLLRRPVQAAWDKNAPHPVEVAEGKPYVLPEWSGPPNTKSLKELGLDTSTLGVYRITGIYMEAAGDAKPFSDKDIRLWGGNIASNTVEVEVAK